MVKLQSPIRNLLKFARSSRTIPLSRTIKALRAAVWEERGLSLDLCRQSATLRAIGSFLFRTGGAPPEPKA